MAAATSKSKPTSESARGPVRRLAAVLGVLVLAAVGAATDSKGLTS